MTPKFSKALLAAGLAAALVGCGGGSSTTTVADGMGDDMPPASDSTAAEEAAKKIQASYDTVKGLVDGLTVTSTAEQIKSVRDQANALLTDIRTTTDLEDRSTFTTNANALLASIDQVVADQREAAEDMAAQDRMMKQDNAWKTALSTHSLDTIGGTAWPTDAIGSRTGGTVGGLSDGWTGRNYAYPLSGLEEQGKTFMKNVTKVTPGITLRWDELAVEAAKTNRSSVIDDFLGSSGIRFEALESGTVVLPSAVEAATDLRMVSVLPGTNLTGSGVVYQIRTGLVAEAATGAAPSGAALFDFDEVTIIPTSFHKSDFETLDANFLATIPDATNAEAWNIDAGFTDFLANSPSPIYVKWKGIPVHVTFADDSAVGDAGISARFNEEGFLEYAPIPGTAAGISSDERFVVSFRPVDPNSLGNIATQNIHSMLLDVREESTKTNAVTEFAYWASERTANPFTVTVKTFAKGMNFGDLTDMPGELAGSATYNGLAAGYYAMGTESNGEFTADAMLTADFGTNTVSGMIDSFMPMTGSDDLSSWELALNAATFMDDTFDNAFSGGTQGGGGEGEWNGQFLGMANPGNTLTLDMTDDYPEAVVGNFRGHFANDGHVVGAFGANLEE